ncbi:hypothetical protein ACFQMA_26105 [Halosimplex aquaticum]|uniref:Uncharacterized protein n=2 Tax=Halobacteriales TaxID=2235 RepID=A0A8U0I1A9_9EURY|nr:MULTISPECIES: hypothetical protein [Halobacteriales]UPV76959.1 hypothetical protein M0R89_22155 [Halorussus limi]
MPAFDREFHADKWSQTLIDYLADADDRTASLDAFIEHIIDQETDAVTPDKVTVTYEVVNACPPTLAENGVVTFDERPRESTTDHQQRHNLAYPLPSGSLAVRVKRYRPTAGLRSSSARVQRTITD